MIIIENLSKSFGDAIAIDSVSLEIADGESIGIVGPSGSGKTSLLRLIAGLEIPDEGTISMDGRLVSTPQRVVEPHKRNIGFVFQHHALWPHMTAAQNVLYGMNNISKAKATHRLNALFASLNLSGLEARRPDELSAGQARRVAIARAIAPHPKYLLMDEPLSNLDEKLKNQVIEVIRESIRSTGACPIYVSHVRKEVEEITGRILHLEKGRFMPEP